MRRLFALLLLASTSGCGAADPDAEAVAKPRDTSLASEASSDAPLDTSVAATDAAVDAESGPAFRPTEGTKAAVDRTAPCTKAEEGLFRPAPEDEALAQACLPTYLIWAPVVCGGPRPACACGPDRCAAGEVAKLVSGEFCVCLNPCTVQAKSVLCADAKRKCIPVDDTTGKQTYVCGGAY